MKNKLATSISQYIMYLKNTSSHITVYNVP